MPSPEDELDERYEQAEAVGLMLADAFIARIERFPSAARQSLLIACRGRLLQNKQIAEHLLHAHETL